MKIEVNIDDYISEEEKRDLAIESFKEAIKSNLFKSIDGTIQADSEATRVIGNITHDIVFEEVQKYIPDAKEKIKDKVRSIIRKSDIEFHVFKKKDAWDNEESLAVTYMNQAVMESKDEFKEKIKKELMEFDVSALVAEQVSDAFDELAGNIYKLSELFIEGKSNPS